MSRPGWRFYTDLLDNRIDLRLAQTVKLLPWSPTSEEQAGGDADPGPDLSRPVVTCVAVVVRPGAAATGERGSMAMGVATEVTTNDIWISIQDRYTGDIGEWHTYDRVYIVDDNEWYQIGKIVPSATGRPDIHLIPLKVPGLQPPK